MKKITLVFCRSLYSQSGASVTMGSLGAYLRKNGFPVRFAFLKRTETSDLEKLGETDIIISKPNFKDAGELLSLLKKAKQNKLCGMVFLCGPFASLNAEAIMKENEWLDGVIIGHPEETALELVRSINNDSWDQGCSGGIWRNPKTGRLSAFKPRKISKSLSDLPFPSRDIEAAEDVNYVNIESRRGCIFRCSYCHVPPYNSQTRGELEDRNPRLIADEIEKLKAEFGKTLFIFNDSCFWRGKQDNERAEKFADELIRRKLNINFYIYLRCSPFPKEQLIKKLAKAGLVRVFLGIENMSGKVQKSFNKPVSADKVRVISGILKRYNIQRHIGYLVFEPYSTLKDVEKNIDFLYDIGELYRLSLLLVPVRVVPGTRLHECLVRDGLLEEDTGYMDIGSGYRFKNRKTKVLWQGLKKMFYQEGEDSYNAHFRKSYFLFEYYCISANLFKCLVKRNEPKSYKRLKRIFAEWDRLPRKANRLIHSYLKTVMAQVRKGESAGEIGDKRIHSGFIKDFNKLLSSDIENTWKNLIASAREEGCERSFREMYRGTDEL